MYVIGLDIGTTGCKAIVFDATGNQYGSAYEEFTVIHTRPIWAEQDPERVWGAVQRVIADAVAQAAAVGVSGKDVVALSLSVLGEGCMPVDSALQPLRNAILGMDYRATVETAELESKVAAQEIFDVTGFRPHPMASLPTWMWMRDHEPEVFERTHMYFTFTEYILTKLGAEEPVVDWPQAGRTMLFDIGAKQWSPTLLDASGFFVDQFARPVPPGTRVGVMRARVASRLGLTGVVHLIAGGQDQTCAALGAGLVQPGMALDSHGTVEGMGVVSLEKNTSPALFDGNVATYTYTIPDRYFHMSVNQVGGLLLKWYRDNFSRAESEDAQRRGMDVYDAMVQDAPREPSQVMVLPHFIGSGAPWGDVSSRGAIVGLSIDTTRNDIVKAIMDSLTYELKINVDYFEQVGLQVEDIRVVGGVSKSPRWMQIKADILDRPVSTLHVKDAACLGAGMIALHAMGAYHDLVEAADTCVRIEDTYEPDPRAVPRYAAFYEKYKTLYGALKEFNHMKVQQ